MMSLTTTHHILNHQQKVYRHHLLQHCYYFLFTVVIVADILNLKILGFKHRPNYRIINSKRNVSKKLKTAMQWLSTHKFCHFKVLA